MRQFISPSTIAATIRMLRSTFKGSFLLVEGDIDARLYGRLVDRHACHVQVCMNRAMVVCVVKILDQGNFVGHLGIVDKDFSGMLPEKYTSENIVYTDENDLELTILCSDTLERFIAEYGNPDKVSAIESASNMTLKDALINAASYIGSLVYLSRLSGWNLVFEGMTFGFNGRNDFNIDLDRQIEHLRGRSQGTSMPELTQVKAEIAQVRQQHAASLAHTRGCDLCEILSKGVHDVFGRNDIELARGGPAVEEVIRTAYSHANFLQTNLYAEIRAWEAKRAPLAIL